MRRIIELFFQPKTYDPRVRATASAGWIAMLENGIEHPIAPADASREQALALCQLAGFTLKEGDHDETV